MKVISHSADADGKLSAFLVAKIFNLTDENDFIMTDYGKHTNWLYNISEGEKVVICDFGFENKAEDMKKLLEITDDIIWIDHHESTINDYGEFEKEIPGIRVVGTAACMLTYIYFYIFGGNYSKVDITQKQCEELYKRAPELVRYVHDYDVWRYDYQNTEKFKLGLDAENITSPIDKRWELLLMDDSYINKVITAGSSILEYRNSLGQNACDNYGFECDIMGKKGFALNNVFGGSPWFGDKIKEYDFVCAFLYMGNNQWEYSFYSEKEDVECYKLAKSINPQGGGHKGAAGCVTDKFIF